MSHQETASAAHTEQPLWRKLALRREEWRSLPGASEYLIRTIKFGIRDPPIVPFTRGAFLPSVPQNAEDSSFAWSKIEKGLLEGTIEEVTDSYARECVQRGLLVSSLFTTWSGEGDDRAGRFVINLHHQSQHFRPGTTRLETLPSF